jgi:purine-binding chemotaxis protein CheW
MQSAQSKSLAMSMHDSDAQTSASSQFLTFFMAGEEYGVDILSVQEIRGWESSTPIPNAPSHIKGVINLRGTIVPIVDLRQCFGLQGIAHTPVTVVIVLKIKSNESSRVIGIVVDAVSDVYSLSQADMRPVPSLGDAVDTDFIRALVTVNDRMVILLNLDRLSAIDELPDMRGFRDGLNSTAV